MRTILALARKDLRVLVRVRSGLFFTFVWPLVVAILFGVVFGGQASSAPRAIRIVAVDEDGSDGSRAFLRKIEASGDFTLDVASRVEAETMVRRGQRAAYVVIRRGFGGSSERMFYGPPREIEIGSDPARGAEAGMIEGLLTKHAMSDLQTLFTDTERSRKMVHDAIADLGATTNGSPTAPVARFLGELDSFLGTPAARSQGGSDGWQPLRVSKTAVARERLGPSNGFEITFPQGIVWGIIGCVMSFAIGLVSERVHGTFVRLQTAPLTRTQILGGKALACFTAIAMLQIVMVIIGVAGFDVRPSSYALLALACACAGLGFVGFMMMVAGLSRTEQAAGGAGWAVLMPMTLFGGGMMPQFVMPAWMQTVGNLSPVKWTILAIEGAIWRNFTLAEMILPCAILLGFGAVCFAVGVKGLGRSGGS
jgi:ABC-2 type transport system permease protein